jgi:hypothetical protein
MSPELVAGWVGAAAEKSALDKLESDRKWKDLTVSTDYSS